MVFINPEFTKKDQPITTNWEACLSVPNAESHIIDRFHFIEITAYNEFGEKFSLKTTHLYASVCLLHESDHLDALLIVDRWKKNDYSEKDLLADINDFLNSPIERKKIKKLKPIEATKIKFDF